MPDRPDGPASHPGAGPFLFRPTRAAADDGAPGRQATRGSLRGPGDRPASGQKVRPPRLRTHALVDPFSVNTVMSTGSTMPKA
ncbi:hypothetical protein GCM10011594_00830 [Nakamurella endophytica]|uniref:Uncharacterized protein n=1 Tax=Nakamurella endophytica TaxID=1748367 RepID=A0A917SJZ1_9ACTN|nr:hypothetical protein GCM10011594_00830 [Nakamurella endophytica]